METFEIKRPELHRSSSTGIPSANKSAPYIIMIAGIILVTGAILVVSHFVLGYKDLDKKIGFLKQNRAEYLIDQTCDEEFCLTKDCVSMASRIMNLMNPRVEPCEDFYEYACGGYAKTTFVPFGQTDYTPAEETKLVIFQKIRSVMESSSNDGNSSTLQKMRQIYSSCSDTERRDELQKDSFNAWLLEMDLTLSGNPNEVTLNLETPGSWRTIVSKLEEYQIHTLFKAIFKGSTSTPVQKIIVDCSLDLYPSDVYLEPSRENLYKLTLYKETIDGVLTLLLMEDSEKQVFIEEVLQMETNIVRAIQASEPATNNRLTDEEILQMREIWRPLIGDAVHDADIVSTCKSNLAVIISALNQASPRMSARYVLWRMLTQIVQYLGNDFRNLQLYYTGYVPFWKHFYDKNWQSCADFIRQELGIASFKFLEDYGFITGQQLENIKNVFTKLKTEILQITRANSRLSRLTKKLFLNKLKTMQLELGYPEVVRNRSVIDTVYENLQMIDDYFLNVMNVKKFKTRYFLNRLWYSNSENVVSEISLEESPLGVSFSYDYKTNKVRLDGSSFWFPMSHYSGNIPKYLKFGETAMLARVMSKAFDATGSLYDAHGRKWDKALLPQTLRDEHTYYTECLMSQLSSSDYWFAEINNTEYINTIAADMGSFLVPYESFKTYLMNATEEKSLPSVNLDLKQMFYVQVAQKYCEVRAPSTDSEEIVGLSKRSRVNIAVSNMEDFAFVFNCQPQHVLNLQHKCNLSS